MTEVIPAILAKTFDELTNTVGSIVGIARMVQVDICDGKFVSNKSWPMYEKDQYSVEAILSEDEGMPYWEKINFEFDLMVENAHKKFDLFIGLGAQRVVFHIEAEEPAEFKDFLEGLDMYTRENTQIGVAINTTTPISALAPIISGVDFVQCMGIEHIGHQGEPFDPRVLDQIKSLRMMYPELIISVDGSVNEQTAPLLVSAGANRLVIGSALLRSFDIAETMHHFQNL